MSSNSRVTRTAFEASQRITSDGFDAVSTESPPPACEHAGCPARHFRTVSEYYRHLDNAHDGQRAEGQDAAVETSADIDGGDPADMEA